MLISGRLPRPFLRVAHAFALLLLLSLSSSPLWAVSPTLPSPPTAIEVAYTFEGGSIETLLPLYSGHRALVAKILRFPLQWDHRLCRAANGIAARFLEEGVLPPMEILDEGVWAVGFPGTSIEVTAIRGEIPEAGEGERVRERLLAPLRTDGERWIYGLGLAAARGPHSSFGAIVLLRSRRYFDHFQAPRRIRHGKVARLTALLSAPWQRIEALLLDPGGAIRTLPLQEEGRRISLFIPSIPADGTGYLELVGSRRGGAEVLLLLPILFGEGGPPPPPRLPTADLPFEDCAEASAWSFFQVNEARRTQGLPPLRFDPHLAALAQDQSRRMREAGRIAHEIPAGRTLARRLAHAGIDVTVAAENVAVNTTPQGALRAFLRSPSHRRNLFDPRFDEIGIGIVIDRAAAYRRRFFVTQIVARRHATVGE